MIFLIDWQWIWFKNYFGILNPENIKYINENPQNVVIFKIVFSINQKSSVLSVAMDTKIDSRYGKWFKPSVDCL